MGKKLESVWAQTRCYVVSGPCSGEKLGAASVICAVLILVLTQDVLMSGMACVLKFLSYMTSDRMT